LPLEEEKTAGSAEHVKLRQTSARLDNVKHKASDQLDYELGTIQKFRMRLAQRKMKTCQTPNRALQALDWHSLLA
jgi:hypothetical protein